MRGHALSCLALLIGRLDLHHLEVALENVEPQLLQILLQQVRYWFEFIFWSRVQHYTSINLVKSRSVSQGPIRRALNYGCLNLTFAADSLLVLLSWLFYEIVCKLILKAIHLFVTGTRKGQRKYWHCNGDPATFVVPEICCELNIGGCCASFNGSTWCPGFSCKSSCAFGGWVFCFVSF